MPASVHLEAISTEGRRLLNFARRDLERVVPQYPTWTLRGLVTHTASIHARTIAVCSSLPQDRIPAPELPPGRGPLAWYAETLSAMVAAFRSADPHAEVWFFTADRTIGAWERRMLIETGVHRWDAQQALEDPDPLLPVVAESGLDEFGDMWLPRFGDLPALHVRATDIGRSWTFGRGNAGPPITGSASDIYLRLMSRPGVRLPAEWAAAVDGAGTPTG
jgi:uncharacterized protein (TIGR03083 family)